MLTFRKAIDSSSLTVYCVLSTQKFRGYRAVELGSSIRLRMATMIDTDPDFVGSDLQVSGDERVDVDDDVVPVFLLRNKWQREHDVGHTTFCTSTTTSSGIRKTTTATYYVRAETPLIPGRVSADTVSSTWCSRASAVIYQTSTDLQHSFPVTKITGLFSNGIQAVFSTVTQRPR